jgi:acetyltransferase-like isoleucine patch superfamily enzyme
MVKKLEKVNRMITDESSSFLRKYQTIVLGSRKWTYLLKYELILFFAGPMPGAIGLALRQLLYPKLLKRCGKGVVFGRNVVIRHGLKIEIGNKVVVDDGCVLDARGEDNRGIVIGNRVIVGRNTVLGCKDGDIIIGNNVGIGTNSMVHAVGGNVVELQDSALLAPYVYLVGGGTHQFEDTSVPVTEQDLIYKGGIYIGSNVWLGARVTVLDGVRIGRDAVIGAGAVVTDSIADYAIAVGVPAKVLKYRTQGAKKE